MSSRTLKPNRAHSQPPLLLPRRYHARVSELSRSRAASAALMEMLRTLVQGDAASSQQPSKKPPAAAAAVTGPPPPPPEALYNPAGRVAFNLRLPADLSHISNDIVRQAIRVQVRAGSSGHFRLVALACAILSPFVLLQTAHGTLMTTHVALLRRLLRCVTALAMSQVHYVRCLRVCVCVCLCVIAQGMHVFIAP